MAWPFVRGTRALYLNLARRVDRREKLLQVRSCVAEVGELLSGRRALCTY